MIDTWAVRFGLGQCGLVATLLLADVAHLADVPTLLAVCLATTLAASYLPAAWAGLLGLVAWAYFTGFVTNRFGVLTFDGADLARLVLLVAVGCAAHWAVWDR